MSETAFVERFSEGLKPFPVKIDRNFEGNHGVPLVMSEMPVTLSKEAAEKAVGVASPQACAGKCAVVLKSIRAPKFTVCYEIPVNDSIYAVKERLISDPNGPLKDTEYGVSSIRLLLKAKTIGDVRQLRELPSTEFTVMLLSKSDEDTIPVPSPIYWGEYSKLVPKPETKEPGIDNEEVVEKPKPGFTDAFWSEIESVVQKYVDDAQFVVSQFKQAIDEPAVPDLD